MTQNALIIGAGVAGPVAAMALRRVGIDATIYEAYPTTAHGVGAFMGLAANGQDALAALDLKDAVRAIGIPTPRMAMLNANGKVLAEIDNGLTLANGTSNLTVRRADLYDVLHAEAVERGVRIEYGKRLTALTQSADSVVAQFDDGTSATGDILIGADGMRSAVRGIIAPGAPKPEYTGLLGTGGYARGISLPGPRDVMYFVFGRRGFFGYQITGDDEVWWFANQPAPAEPTAAELAGRTPEWSKRLLTELFADDAPPARQIVEVSDDNVDWLPMHSMAAPRTWHQGRVVLIGDAAHVTSPSSGQGASLAIEDAVTLARCLRDLPDAAAFASYQGLRADRVKKIHASAKRVNNSKAAGPVGRVFRDLLTPVFLKVMASPKSLQWLHGHHIDFEAPVGRSAAAA